MRVGLLTGGGDCPGLNAVIRAVVRRGLLEEGATFCGFRSGWAGVLAGEWIELDRKSTSALLPRGGTILGTSRTNPFSNGADGVAPVRASMDKAGVDVLIPIGGDDTLGVALKLHEAGIPVVGVPKTIDNDLGATDFTFGFQTAVQIATDAIDRLHTTAESHNRVMVVEVMGRHAGWIATYAGIAGGADAILVPERPFDVDALCELLERATRAAGRSRSSSSPRVRRRSREASRRSPRTPTRSATLDWAGSAMRSRCEIEERTGYETRVTSSATSSVAARRRPTTACSRPALASPRWRPRSVGASATWSG